ncbi:MAG TPA: zinc ribbon domain-containing protein [Ilumatobacter sp.]
MPLYEYRCRTCDEVFEVHKPMSESATSATCPTGHDDTVRLLSMFARSGVTSTAGSQPASGGCCGGACGCAR